MKTISSLAAFFLLILMVGCNGCATTKPLSQRQLSKMVVLKDGRECQFIVTDPEDQMFLTILVTADDIREFSPKTHTLIVFEANQATRLKSVAFAATAKLDISNRELTVTFIDNYRINQTMFQLLVEKYNTIHIDTDEVSSEEPAAPPVGRPSTQTHFT